MMDVMPAILDPDLLRSFVAIAETGGFTTAAERVHRTQSAVSMQMRRLEEQLGRPLFERHGRGVALAPDGELLLPHARRILAAHQEAAAAFDGAALDGAITIGSPDDYASLFLPPILARFAATHPKVEVTMIVEPSRRLLERMAAGNGPDLAIVTAGCGERTGTEIHRAPLVWVGSPNHDLHRADPLPLALFDAPCCFRAATLEALAGAGRAARIAYSSVSVAGIRAAVQAGLAIATLLRSTVGPDLRMLGEAEGLPALPDFALVAVRAPGARGAVVDTLEAQIRTAFQRTPLALAA
jgi:DNA-binding transcriptional LysR family regulator